MEVVVGTLHHYPWGSTTLLPRFLGLDDQAKPWAELWFGAHPLGPTFFPDGSSILTRMGAAPDRVLGKEVVATFGTRLPYLLKLISPDRPLSLQVHPSKREAEEGYAREVAAGVDLASPRRQFRDANHKPELVYALTPFEALSGFRAPRRAGEILSQLASPLGRELAKLIERYPGHRGLEHVTRRLLDPSLRPDPGDVEATVAAAAERLRAGVSPSVRADRTVLALARSYPGDPAAILALVLNPVTLRPGQTLFTPAGSPHCYLHGLGVEIMADSDNVLRAGLTTKYVDAQAALAHMTFVGAPPVRIAPEEIRPHTKVFYAPVDDFELTLTTVNRRGDSLAVPGRGPRLILVIDGEVKAESGGRTCALARGEAAFVEAEDGPLRVSGRGRLVQAGVP
ncbi:MAG: mannose-6-phosphate isomerase, class I [Actinomycetaceae bacterium]|nr:mannose-6-phosphate isomerase, class I [Actinomycetaceae bacterium]